MFCASSANRGNSRIVSHSGPTGGEPRSKFVLDADHSQYPIYIWAWTEPQATCLSDVCFGMGFVTLLSIPTATFCTRSKKTPRRRSFMAAIPRLHAHSVTGDLDVFVYAANRLHDSSAFFEDGRRADRREPARSPNLF